MAKMSERIKMLRTSAGLTQEEFGNIFGIVKSTVSLYESGKSCPNDQMKIKMCEHFNVPLDFLIGISNISNVNADGFSKSILSDGKCHSAFVDLASIRKMSIDDIAKTTGIDKEVLDTWFVKEVPTLQQLVLVADCLRTSVDYLLGRAEYFNKTTPEEMDILSYYHQLNKLDQRWIAGKMIDQIKEYNNDEVVSSVAAGEENLRKAK